MLQLAVTRTLHNLLPDPRRVILKPHLPGEEAYTADGRSRVHDVLERILTLPPDEIAAVLENVLRDFGPRHRDFTQGIRNNFQLVAHHLEQGVALSETQRLLIGAYFSHEYSVEGAALFNPSLVPAPDQSGLAAGEQRFIMSVRAVGEGHISSIGFRTGVIDQQSCLTFDPLSRFAMTGRRMTPLYDRHLFRYKLGELGADRRVTSLVLDPLSEQFTFDDLERGLTALEEPHVPHTTAYDAVRLIHLLASSNYVLAYPRDSAVSERILFPGGPRESHGMEDARFVQFVDEDGTVAYYATYTAYDGSGIIPQLIETKNFLSFRVSTLNGACAQNKGMALFPRLVAGRYTMLSRLDRENIYLMRSDNVRFWNDSQLLRAPLRPWELVQIGNCGSPIETEAGWLVLTHGVGAMRRYAIGAMLLDLDDPGRVIAHLPEPLLEPEADEREGYVPNVLYSCGSMVHRGTLIIPYAYSDVGIKVASIPLSDLLGLLADHPM